MAAKSTNSSDVELEIRDVLDSASGADLTSNSATEYPENESEEFHARREAVEKHDEETLAANYEVGQLNFRPEVESCAGVVVGKLLNAPRNSLSKMFPGREELGRKLAREAKPVVGALAFQSGPLSNHWMGESMFFGLYSVARSAEHALYHLEARALGLPEITEAESYELTVEEIRTLRHKWRRSREQERQWERIRVAVMLYVIRKKFLTFGEARSFLLATNDTVLIEATRHRIWGCGTNILEEAFDMSGWPPKAANVMGTLLRQVRAEARVKIWSYQGRTPPGAAAHMARVDRMLFWSQFETVTDKFEYDAREWSVAGACVKRQVAPIGGVDRSRRTSGGDRPVEVDIEPLEVVEEETVESDKSADKPKNHQIEQPTGAQTEEITVCDGGEAEGPLNKQPTKEPGVEIIEVRERHPNERDGSKREEPVAKDAGAGKQNQESEDLSLKPRAIVA